MGFRADGCLTWSQGNAECAIKRSESFVYFFKSPAPNFFVFDVPCYYDYNANYYSKQRIDIQIGNEETMPHDLK